MTSNSTADTAGWNIGKVDATYDQYRHKKNTKIAIKRYKSFSFFKVQTYNNDMTKLRHLVNFILFSDNYIGKPVIMNISYVTLRPKQDTFMLILRNCL